MKFKTHNDKDIDSTGISLCDYITISYDLLLRTFGAPAEGDKYKVDAEWVIEFEDGRVATIYNYKDGKNYNGRDGKAVENIKEWHIGGKDNSVIDIINDILKDSPLRLKNLEKFESVINAPTQDEWKTMLDCLEKYKDRLQEKDDKTGFEIDISYKIEKLSTVIPDNVINAFK